jgi:hypothetical protein
LSPDVLSCFLEAVFLSELLAEKTRLHGAGLLGVPFGLATRAPNVLAAAPGLSRSSALLLLATHDGMGHAPSGGGGDVYALLFL